MSTVANVGAREVLDSRGNPTIEVDVTLSDGALGRASAPSGASKGSDEAVEFRDDNPCRYNGLGVLQAVEKVHREIAPEIMGLSAMDQSNIDHVLIDLDGSTNKSRLGANTIIAVSIAVAQASAQSKGIPLYRLLDSNQIPMLPVPMFNILNGGKHAHNSTDIQEFMVVPVGFTSFKKSLQAGSEIYKTLKDILEEKGLSTNTGDEGGFAPNLTSGREAAELVLQSIERAGYKAGEECFIAIDVAASELEDHNGNYSFRREQTILSTQELIQMYNHWVQDYPIISIEDGVSEKDPSGWKALTNLLGEKLQLVGDDLYTTNPSRIKHGIKQEMSNAVLIKLNQIGTVTETLDALNIAKMANWGTVISHRSGETEDTTIADLAVGTAAGQIKAGAPARGERTAKYNRLLRIEDELGTDANYPGRAVYKSFM